MIRMAGGRGYDLVILSDHGMTAAKSYRVQFKETLASTVARLLREAAPDDKSLHSHASFSDTSEYASIGPDAMDTVAELAGPPMVRRMMLRVSDWLRSRYGIRELILPEKYRVDEENNVVITYSSCLAHIYFADRDTQLSMEDIGTDSRWRGLYQGLLAHDGVGLIATRTAEGVHLETREGSALIRNGATKVLSGKNPFDTYGSEPMVARSVESLVMQQNAGDCVLFGAYDGESIISFDDQIGAHGSAGGDQVLPFIVAPTWLDLENQTLEDARDIHRAVMTRYPKERVS
jgi:hypothetical protein